ncbi:MAG: hypothetical protein ACYTJ0_10210 [Planctomycetota bacterium]|jgi:hypothetical protein
MPTRAENVTPLLLTVLLALSLLGGCRSADDPSVRVVGASMVEQTDEAVRLAIDLELSNPSGEPVKMLEFNYTVGAAGRTAFSGRRAALVAVDRFGSRIVTVPAIVPFERVGWADGPPESFDFSVSGSLLYLLPGALNRTLMEIGLRRPRVSFQGRGTVGATEMSAAPSDVR